MASVYWIHLPEHTDITTSGYIGFTSKTVEGRFKKHRQDSFQKNKRNYTLHHAIRKYDEQLQVTTLVEGSEEYCLMIEEKLRPHDSIGWNQMRGGSKPPLRRGQSEETRRKLSIAHTGRVHSEERRQNNREAQKKLRQNMHPWEFARVDTSVWLLAETLFSEFLSQEPFGNTAVARRHEKTVDSVMKVVSKIKSGWVPSGDISYQEWKAAQEQKENNVT